VWFKRMFINLSSLVSFSFKGSGKFLASNGTIAPQKQGFCGRLHVFRFFKLLVINNPIKYKQVLGKILLLLVILLVGGLTIFGCTGTRAQPKGWSGGTIADGTLLLGSMEGKIVALDTSTGNSLWEVQLKASSQASRGFSCAPGSTTVAIYGTPIVEGDLVYVGGYNGKIYAINLNKGVERWVYPREDYLQPIIGGVVVSQGKVYYGGSDGKVYALDAATGDREWEFQTGDKIWSTPAIGSDTLYVSSFDKKLYALSATDGSKKWEFQTEGAIASTPLVYNDTVYIGSFDRYLYAIDANDGSLKWKFMANNWFWARPVVYNNVIYAGCLDGNVYVLDAGSGNEFVDAIELGSPISSSPVLVDSSIIVASEEGKVYSIDTGDNQKNELKDLEEKIYAPLGDSEGTVYIHTEKDALYALELKTGSIREFQLSSK